MQPTNRLRLKWNNASCTFNVALPPGEKDEIARVGPLTCSEYADETTCTHLFDSARSACLWPGASPAEPGQLQRHGHVRKRDLYPYRSTESNGKYQRDLFAQQWQQKPDPLHRHQQWCQWNT
ncbi:hypothetical protein LP416_17470 [Polaromonas sp. P2-4]|nr:hypothetical protein LP416_17470 [Polaromonas sp. P2-4]